MPVGLPFKLNMLLELRGWLEYAASSHFPITSLLQHFHRRHTRARTLLLAFLTKASNPDSLSFLKMDNALIGQCRLLSTEGP